MPARVTIDQICAQLNARCLDVVARVIPSNCRRPVRGNKIWALNPLRADPSWDSFCIYTDKGVFVDYSAAAGDRGDMYKFVAKFLYNGDNKAAYKWALSFLGLEGGKAPDPAELKQIEENRAEQERKAAEALARQRARCMAIWLESKPLAPGDPPSLYLLKRGVDVHALPEGAPSCLRYHPSLDMPTSTYWGGKHKNRVRRDGPFPALVAMVSLEGIKSGCATIHATALQATDEGWWKAKRAVRDDGKELKPKEVFCEYRGGTIRLTKGESGLPLSKAPQGEWMLMSEGIENGLSAALVRPNLRVAAGVSVANMANVALPPQIAGVTILADNDAADSQAEAGLTRAMDELAKRGLDVAVARVDRRFKDFNAALMGV